MGLFDTIGNGLKGLFGEGFADRAAIAQALISDNPEAVAGIRASQAHAAAEKQKAEMAQQAMIHAYSALKAMGMSDDQAITLASDPQVAAGFMADRNKTQQYSASGGSSYDPVTGQSRMAPSRHEFQGSVFDVGGGAPGQQMPTTVQHEGTQWITPQPGTTAFGVNSFTGLPRSGEAPPAPPMSEGKPQGPVVVKSKEEVDALPTGTEFIGPDGKVRVKTGGPTGAPSGGFPY